MTKPLHEPAWVRDMLGDPHRHVKYLFRRLVGLPDPKLFYVAPQPYKRRLRRWRTCSTRRSA